MIIQTHERKINSFTYFSKFIQVSFNILMCRLRSYKTSQSFAWKLVNQQENADWRKAIFNKTVRIGSEIGSYRSTARRNSLRRNLFLLFRTSCFVIFRFNLRNDSVMRHCGALNISMIFVMYIVFIVVRALFIRFCATIRQYKNIRWQFYLCWFT